jgi:bifunctional UDP-N-acetylglucosamine pyrophosphorylase / glucosamine-1-phosphate N-acetyltransferase
MSYGIIILAAGNGSRMHSKIPKVLHKLAGKTMLERLIATSLSVAQVEQIVVVAGANIRELQVALPEYPIFWAHQLQQLGTADAVAAGLKLLDDKIKNVLILSGDTPLISKDTLDQLINNTNHNNIGIVTSHINISTGYGRIVRDANNNFIKIIEELDATNLEKQITEINVGVYLFPKNFLINFLPKINNNNKKQEYYLTELLSLAVEQSIIINSQKTLYSLEKNSVNTKEQLIKLERKLQFNQAVNLLKQGVTILDPKRLDIRGDVTIAKDVEIDVNVILIGKVLIESGVKIGANCYIKDSIIGENSIIEPNSVIDGSNISANVIIGPFARLRPGTHIGTKSKIGNFVEIKATSVGEFSKINHLSYVGNAKIGNNVNIGAGTITCNYDGVNKYITTIEDSVMVGSGCQLIAPITIGNQAFIAAGTTLINDAPANKLTLNKKLQQSRELVKQEN